MQRRVFVLSTLAAFALLLAGCAPAAPAPTPPPKPTAAPAKPAEAKPAPKAEAKPAEAKPAAKPEAKPPAEWDRIVAAAKQEGRVVVAAQVGDIIRDAMTQGFQREFGISVEYTGARGGEHVAKIITERQAGLFAQDIVVVGTTSGDDLQQAGGLDPIDPHLILPDVKDPKNWRGGAHEYYDDNKRLFIMTAYQRGTLHVNPNMVNPAEFRSYKDLLDPKWKGQMVADDPRTGGPGQATWTLFLLHPELGLDYIRALARQDLLILRDWKQEADMIGQGRYPVLVGGNDFTIDPMTKSGIPIVAVPPPQLREGSDLSAGGGVLLIVNRPAHPNAAKVYANWLLGKEGQTAFSRSTGYVSNRLDVPTDHLDSWRVPLPGAIRTYTPDSIEAEKRLRTLLQDLLPS